jgi:hypothetical protein
MLWARGGRGAGLRALAASAVGSSVVIGHQVIDRPMTLDPGEGM